MAVIEKFLGKTVEIPEDRRYCRKTGLWGRQADAAIVFGLTQPALVLMGGIKDVAWLLAEGQMAQAESYIETLASTEGFTNPEGIKGGVSGICKALYSGIGQQKI